MVITSLSFDKRTSIPPYINTYIHIHILTSPPCTTASVGKVWTDVLSLIEDLQYIHSAIETTERVKKKLDVVNEKTQMTSYRILQSKALTKYARNRLRSLVTKESSHVEET